MLVSVPIPTGHVIQRMRNGHFSLYSGLNSVMVDRTIGGAMVLCHNHHS